MYHTPLNTLHIFRSLNENSVKMMEDFNMKEEFRLIRVNTDPRQSGIADEYKDTTFAITSISVCGF